MLGPYPATSITTPLLVPAHLARCCAPPLMMLFCMGYRMIASFKTAICYQSILPPRLMGGLLILLLVLWLGLLVMMMFGLSKPRGKPSMLRLKWLWWAIG